MREFTDVMALCDHIRETSFDLHRFLRHGHLEKVYENGLLHRLKKTGLHVESQYPLSVTDVDGTVLGKYFVDLYVSWPLMIEVKACESLHPAHIAQLLGYLRAAHVEHGLIINFGAPKLQIKKLALLDNYPDLP